MDNYKSAVRIPDDLLIISFYEYLWCNYRGSGTGTETRDNTHTHTQSPAFMELSEVQWNRDNKSVNKQINRSRPGMPGG